MTSEREALDKYLRDDLPELVRVLMSSPVRELEIGNDDVRLAIRRAEPSADAGEALAGGAVDGAESLDVAARDRDTHRTGIVSSPMVGTFFHSEHPGGAPLVSEGSRVEPGNLIGVIEALQVLTEVESDVRGIVEKILAPDGQPVEYGQPLVEVLLDT
jgi:acetyl-CoA carboxylase biotin carboxyl carrier protein